MREFELLLASFDTAQCLGILELHSRGKKRSERGKNKSFKLSENNLEILCLEHNSECLRVRDQVSFSKKMLEKKIKCSKKESSKPLEIQKIFYL